MNNTKIVQKIKHEPSTKDELDRLHHASIQTRINDPYSNPNMSVLKELYNDGLAMKTQHRSVMTYDITRKGINVLQDIAQDKIIKQHQEQNDNNRSESTYPKRTQASRLESKMYTENTGTKATVLSIFNWITIVLISLTSLDFIFINGVTPYHYFSIMIVYILILISTVSLE